jgi:hypothetical protein
MAVETQMKRSDTLAFVSNAFLYGTFLSRCRQSRNDEAGETIQSLCARWLRTLRDLSAYAAEHLETILSSGILLLRLFSLRDENNPLKGAMAQADAVSKIAGKLLTKHREGKPLESWEVSSLQSETGKFEHLLEYDLDQ